MNSRSRMVQRAIVQRNSAQGEQSDPAWGDDPPAWVDLYGGDAPDDPLPCRWWADVGRGEIVAPDRAATLGASRMMVPRGTNITTGDRVVRITDRLGDETFAGPLDIEQVIPRSDHLLVMMTVTRNRGA